MWHTNFRRRCLHYLLLICGRIVSRSSYLWICMLLLPQEVDSVSSPFWSCLALNCFDLLWPTDSGKSDTGPSMGLTFKKTVNFSLGPRLSLTLLRLVKSAWAQLVNDERSQERGSGRWEAILGDPAPAERSAEWHHMGHLVLYILEKKNRPAELSPPTESWEKMNCRFKPLGLLCNSKLLKYYSSGIYRQNKFLSFPHATQNPEVIS